MCEVSSNFWIMVTGRSCIHLCSIKSALIFSLANTKHPMFGYLDTETPVFIWIQNWYSSFACFIVHLHEESGTGQLSVQRSEGETRTSIHVSPVQYMTVFSAGLILLTAWNLSSAWLMHRGWGQVVYLSCATLMWMLWGGGETIPCGWSMAMYCTPCNSHVNSILLNCETYCFSGYSSCFTAQCQVYPLCCDTLVGHIRSY